jgi:hypothetical protein
MKIRNRLIQLFREMPRPAKERRDPEYLNQDDNENVHGANPCPARQGNAYFSQMRIRK